jgi:hypothetical protein
MSTGIAYASEGTDTDHVVSDNAEERIAEYVEDGVTYRSVYDKINAVLTTYTIIDGEVTDVFSVTQEKLESLAESIERNISQNVSTYAATTVQAPCGFGYVLDSPNNSYRCPEDFKEEMGLTYLGFRIGENTLSDYQKDLRTAIENLITYENQVINYTNSSTFANIMALVLTFFGQTSSAFSSAYTAYGYSNQAKTAATYVHTNYCVAGSRFCRLEQSKL